MLSIKKEENEWKNLKRMKTNSNPSSNLREINILKFTLFLELI